MCDRKSVKKTRKGGREKRRTGRGRAVDTVSHVSKGPHGDADGFITVVERRVLEHVVHGDEEGTVAVEGER